MRASGLSLGVIGMVVLLGASGCVDNGTSIFVRQVALANPDEDCTVTADPSAGTRLGGTLDRRFRSEYNQDLLMGNQLVPRGDEDTLRIESARVQLFEVEVEVFDFDGVTLDSFVTPASGFIDPADGDTPGFGLVRATMIAPSTLGFMDARVANEGLPANRTVVSRLIVKGETLGGDDVEARAWDFPIDVCTAQDTDDDGDFDTCVGCFIGEDDEPLPACRLGQDTEFDCRLLD